MQTVHKSNWLEQRGSIFGLTRLFMLPHGMGVTDAANAIDYILTVLPANALTSTVRLHATIIDIYTQKTHVLW